MMPKTKEEISISISSLSEDRPVKKYIVTYVPSKMREQVNNPLFYFETRPNVSEVMFKDIIKSY